MTAGGLRTDIAVGVDGCPGGWVAAVWEPETSRLTIQAVCCLSDLVERCPDVAIGVDIPIGIAESEPRACDVAARKLLGRPRGSSVFPAPCRDILRLNASYAETSAESRRLTGRGISQQTYHIIPKIAEADGLMTPDLQRRVFEVHPEVSFYAMNGGHPMRCAKKRTAGFNERRDVLRTVFPFHAIPTTRSEAKALASESRCFGKGAGADDVLDAIAAAWSALRFARGDAGRIPEERTFDRSGLAMEIVY